MLTAMLAVENINGASHDIWAVNADQGYHEELKPSEQRKSDFANISETQPLVPTVISEPDPALAIIQRAFGRIHEMGLGLAVGAIGALYTFLAIAWVLVRPEETLATTIQLLEHFFIGFTVSWWGALIGLFYGFNFGFVLGWSIAHVRNTSLNLYLYFIKLREEAKVFEP